MPNPAIVVGGLSAGSNYIGARKAAKASESAAETAADAQNRAADLIYKQFQETKAALQPYSDLGLPAAQEQQALLGLAGEEAQQAAMDRFQESPGYQFRLQRGLGTIDQGAAASGSLISGAREKARMQFGQGLASSEFANYFNRLGSQAGLGLSATQAIGGVGSQAAQGQAQMTAAAGESIAQGGIAKAQAYQSGFSNIAQGLGSIYETYRKNNGQ